MLLRFIYGMKFAQTLIVLIDPVFDLIHPLLAVLDLIGLFIHFGMYLRDLGIDKSSPLENNEYDRCKNNSSDTQNPYEAGVGMIMVFLPFIIVDLTLLFPLKSFFIFFMVSVPF